MPVLAGGQRRLYLGAADEMRIDVIAEDGTVERRLRIPSYELSVSDAEWDDRYQGRLAAPSIEWLVFDEEGRWRGRLESPEGLTVTQIGADLIIGLARTESSSEARLYALTR